MYYLDGRWRHQSLVYFGNPGASSANVAAGHFREYVPRPHEMSYRSHWTINEPNDIQTALGRARPPWRSPATSSRSGLSVTTA